jgi:hypothetical protein
MSLQAPSPRRSVISPFIGPLGESDWNYYSEHPLFDEVHTFCTSYAYDSFDDHRLTKLQQVMAALPPMLEKINALRMEMEAKGETMRLLALRTKRLNGDDLNNAIDSIARLALFLHLGNLTLKKFDAFLNEVKKGVEKL